MKRLWLLLALAGCARSQHEVTAAGDLLTSDGRLREPGWARRQLLTWNGDRVADPSRLRQWDFFTIMNDQAAVNLTLADLGFVQAATVGVVDFPSNTTERGALSVVGANDRLALSAAVDGEASFTPAGATTPAMRFVSDDNGAQLDIAMPASFGDAATGSFTIMRAPAAPFLSLATPFDDDAHEFFFEQKIPGMSATGMLTAGGQTWNFTDGAVAVMDWGRGQWPAMPMWHWAAGAGNGFAFNLGDGFGDAAAATENLLVVGDAADKLAEVDWTHDADDAMADWTFHGRDGRVSVTLHPMATELGALDLGADYQHLQKAYGRFSGTIIRDDGTALVVDGALGFAEEVSLSW